MVRRKGKPPRKRIGQVSYYFHHGAWHLYYREAGRAIRRRIGLTEAEAVTAAAQVNAQLATSVPTPFAFRPIGIPQLRQAFLEHHEDVLRSSLATVRRYRSASQHLEDFVASQGAGRPAHEVQAAAFVRYLRTTKVAPNGHANSARRHLRDKGVCFVLEVCRSLYGFAAKQRYLPPYFDNPFGGMSTRRMRIEDAKEIHVFDEASELAFLRAAGPWDFPIHFALAKGGLRPGELVHLLIEDLDLENGWLRVRNKPDLGWRIKTGRERAVPLIPPLVAVLRRVIGPREAGPVFLRPKYSPEKSPFLVPTRRAMARRLQEKIAELEKDKTLSREKRAMLARKVWREAGAPKHDAIRLSYMRVTESIGLPEATCPKSWRHTFATLLQEANVDLLIRQITLGHQPTSSGVGPLGMTTVYTHTRLETQHREICRAMELWPKSLELAREWAKGGAPC